MSKVYTPCFFYSGCARAPQNGPVVTMLSTALSV